MTVYDRIRSRREELGMSQQDLANKIGYKSRSAINKIEQGLRDISQSKIAAFAKALETTPAYLMGWEEEKAPSVPEDGEDYIVMNRGGNRRILHLNKEQLDYLEKTIDLIKPDEKL